MKNRVSWMVVTICFTIPFLTYGQTGFHAKKQGVIKAKTAQRRAPGAPKADLRPLLERLREHLNKPDRPPRAARALPVRDLQWRKNLGKSLQVLTRDDAKEYRHYKRGVVAVEPREGKRDLFKARAGETAGNLALRYVEENQNLFGLKLPRTELVEKRRNFDAAGMTHVMFQQTHEGIPFWGRELRAHLDFAGNLVSVNGLLQPTVSGLVTEPRLSAAEAVAAATERLESIGKPVVLTPGQMDLFRFGAPGAELNYWQAAPLGKTELVWVVEIHPNLIDWYRLFVSASNGKILEYYNCTAHADGPKTAQATNLLGETVTLNTYELTSEFYLIDGSRNMFEAGQTPQNLINNPKGAIVTWDLQNNDLKRGTPIFDVKSANNTWSDPTAVSAHQYGGLAYSYFRDTHGRNSLDGKGGTIITFIHVTEDGQGLDNAYWNGKAMIFGDGKDAFKPLARALDVAVHEMSHGVIQNSADLEYKFQSGALNESYADVFGVFVDNEDSQLGEDIIKDTTAFPTGALRDMADPHNGGSSQNDPSWQPATMSEFVDLAANQDNGGVHVNSGIPNHAAWKIMQAVGFSDAEQIYYLALTQYLGKQSNFLDARIALSNAAKELFGDGSAQQNAVKQAFDDVGIVEGTGSEPPPDVPVLEGEEFILFVSFTEFDNTLKLSIPGSASFAPFGLWNVNLNSARPYAVDPYGQIILYVNDPAFDLNIIGFDGQQIVEQVVDDTTNWSSLAISPDGNKVALTRNFDENIIVILDIGAEPPSSKEITLLHPTTAEGEFQDIVRFADALVWFDNRTLFYDCLNSMTSPGGETIDFWDVNMVDVTTDQILPVLPPQPTGVSVGNPTFASTNNSILCVDVLGETAEVMAVDLFSGKGNVIFNNGAEPAFPDYSVDDKFLIFSRPNTFGTYDVWKIPLNQNKISASGPEELIHVDAILPTWFAIGTPPSVSVGFASASSQGSEAVTSVNVAVTLTEAATDTVTVDYTATGGNAIGNGVDYTLAKGTLTFNPGETAKNISIAVVDDTQAEKDETIVISLTRPVAAWMGDNATHTYTITNDDDQGSTPEAGIKNNKWGLYR